MSSKERSLIVAATFSIYVLAHLVTLTRTPLAWRNEDFFASMADSLALQGTPHVLTEGRAWALRRGPAAAFGMLITPGSGYAVIVMGLILVLRLYRECRRPAASSAGFPLGESWQRN